MEGASQSLNQGSTGTVQPLQDFSFSKDFSADKVLPTLDYLPQQPLVDMSLASNQTDLPFWQVNVPLDKRPAKCPDFLADANDKDRRILGTPDSAYHLLTWSEVREIIAANRIDLFQRVPSELRRYREYMALLKRNHGSVMDFVMKERLHWTDLTPKAEPFVDPSNKASLYNMIMYVRLTRNGRRCEDTLQ